MDAPNISDNPLPPPAAGGVIRRLMRDRRAGTAVEYGFILALIVLAMIGALSTVGDITVSMWNDISTKVINAH